MLHKDEYGIIKNSIRDQRREIIKESANQKKTCRSYPWMRNGNSSHIEVLTNVLFLIYMKNNSSHV